MPNAWIETEDAAADLVRGIVGERLDRLIESMLDFEVSPAFLWQGFNPEVEREAEQVASIVAAEDQNGSVEAFLATLDSRSAFDRDPVRAILQLATSAPYFAIPISLLEPPVRESKVFSTIPALWERLDNRGLINVDSLEARPDILLVGEFAVPYHQLLRRSFGSHVNDALLAELLKLARGGVPVRLAIDERRLHLRAQHRLYLERDYWNGPPMTEDRLDDPSVRSEEILVHGWAEGQERPLGDNAVRAAVRLRLEGSIRTIEVEELTDPTLEGRCDFQLVRYLHAERDVARHLFTHVDGAVRFYPRDRYEERCDLRWPTTEVGAPAGRRKVFRADGDIATAQWSDLVALWFRGNHLIREALAALGSDASSRH